MGTTINHPQVIVGGLGGSGTRVVAEILSRAGIFMGNVLNKANDNLKFTLLLKKPEWFAQSSEEEQKERIYLFERWSKNQLSLSDRATILQLLASKKDTDNANLFKGNRVKLLRRLFDSGSAERWGWKEPNSHLYLDRFMEVYPEVKYIHVARNGFDMAYSRNKQQLYNWHRFFELEKPNVSNDVHLQLEYWLRSQERIVEIGKKSNAVLILDFEDFCKNPGIHVPKILSFVGASVSADLMNELIGLPRVPATTNRYKSFSKSDFTESQLERMEVSGYSY